MIIRELGIAYPQKPIFDLWSRARGWDPHVVELTVSLTERDMDDVFLNYTRFLICELEDTIVGFVGLLQIPEGFFIHRFVIDRTHPSVTASLLQAILSCAEKLSERRLMIKTVKNLELGELLVKHRFVIEQQGDDFIRWRRTSSTSIPR